jgi:hypothetical protein
VGSISGVSVVHAVSLFRAEVIRLGEYAYIQNYGRRSGANRDSGQENARRHFG